MISNNLHRRVNNLYFNHRTELNTEYDFAQDVTKYRIEEARDAKGRVTLWVKVTFRNIDNWKSLPSRFYVTAVPLTRNEEV